MFRATRLRRSAIDAAMTKESFRDLLLAELERSEALRARTAEDAAFSEKRGWLRDWQAARLARTHADLLESRRFHAAAQFFLDDLYGPEDIGRHIEEVRRIVPVMTRVLPDSGLATVAHAVELNALSESLDGAMVEALGDAPRRSMRRLTRRLSRQSTAPGTARARSISSNCLGNALDRLTHIHFIGVTLKMMRGPADLAGLAELQAFLERGYLRLRRDAGRGQRVRRHRRQQRSGRSPGRCSPATTRRCDAGLRRPCGADRRKDLSSAGRRVKSFG